MTHESAGQKKALKSLAAPAESRIYSSIDRDNLLKSGRSVVVLVVGRSGGNSQYWIVRELQRHPIYRSFGSRTLLVADLRRDYNGESERLMRELDIKYEDFPTAVLFAPNAIPVIVKNVENARDIEQRASVEIARDINE